MVTTVNETGLAQRCAPSMQVIDLCGKWTLQQAGTEHGVRARVPGCVHLDLLAAKQIEDPFYRDNEDRVQWIGQADWIYTRTFTVAPAILAHDRVLLRCLGLDTLAVITINGHDVATTDNMFRTWEFDVKPFLQPGRNTIAIRFNSPLPYIERRQQETSVPGWNGPREVTGRSWVRKEPCNFGWDWGPVLITCGIWRPLQLVAYNTARLTDVQIRQRHETAGVVLLDVSAAVETVSPGTAYTAGVTVRLHGKVVAKTAAPVELGAAEVTLVIEKPQLWWPNGLGDQPLYEVQVSLRDEQGRRIDEQSRRIGLRTLRLEREADQWGESFRFVVNGVPFFAKGANWIPADAFAPRVGREEYTRLLTSAAQANMNMLRVWGGGIYEDDTFYDLCDKLGICIWQDFMFACSTYPAFDQAFMDNVRAEAVDNVRRLRHHPCIALWCGNNELEQGLVGDEWNGWQMSWEDYGKLFDMLLPEVITAHDPDRDYWPCSPHSPHGDRKDHSNPNWGDAHLWDVWHGKKPFEWYRTCEHRFASEFGFQSFPRPQTVFGYTARADRNITSYVMEHHQRSGIGNTTIISYMLDWFRLPEDFSMTLWLSQILHGMAMKYAVENWRRHMPRTMGTIYWQLNDCWPVASWASLEYPGPWKALHYMARHFYNPLLVSGVENPETGTVELHVTSDLLKPQSATLAWMVTDVNGKKLAGDKLAVETPTGQNLLADTIDLSSLLAEHGKRGLLVWLDLSVAGKTVSTNLVTFARPKHLELTDPGITTTVKDLGNGTFQVTLKAQKPSLWTWLDLRKTEAEFSDNFFHLRPNKTVQVLVKPATALSAAEFSKQLRVRSLVDTY